MITLTVAANSWSILAQDDAAACCGKVSVDVDALHYISQQQAAVTL